LVLTRAHSLDGALSLLATKHARAAEWTVPKAACASKWERVCVEVGASGNQKPARAAEWTARKRVRNAHPPMHARLPTDSPTGRRNAPWLSMPSGVVGNNATLLVVLAATIASLLVVIIVLIVVFIVRNRRAARATDPAPDLRTPLYLE
jgi:hypothetical protein